MKSVILVYLLTTMATASDSTNSINNHDTETQANAGLGGHRRLLGGKERRAKDNSNKNKNKNKNKERRPSNQNTSNNNNGSRNQNNKNKNNSSGSQNNNNKNNGSGSGNNGNSNGSNSDVSNNEEIEHDKWKQRGGDGSGLTVEVLNNLQPKSIWNSYLTSTVRHWDSSNALDLSLRTVDTFDPDCNVVMWSIKVCNDDFGETDWKGFNRIMLGNGQIVASLAKMNDYYLPGMDDDELLYTMCHEVGHGFGLKHSDENFHNGDLYDCMDYTNKHENNMHPGKANFKALRNMYGRVNEGERNLKASNVDTLSDRRMNVEEEILMLKDFDKYAAYMSDPVTLSSKNSNDESQGWRLLRKTDNAEYHERQLGDGYSILTSVLIA